MRVEWKRMITTLKNSHDQFTCEFLETNEKSVCWIDSLYGKAIANCKEGRRKYASAVNQMEHICVLGIDLFITWILCTQTFHIFKHPAAKSFSQIAAIFQIESNSERMIEYVKYLYRFVLFPFLLKSFRLWFVCLFLPLFYFVCVKLNEVIWVWVWV